VNVGFDSVTETGYNVEGGLRYKTAMDFSVFGAVSWRDAFNDPVIGIGGVPGTGISADLGRYLFTAGVEF
jgi:hypothetical protein